MIDDTSSKILEVTDIRPSAVGGRPPLEQAENVRAASSQVRVIVLRMPFASFCL